MAVSLMRLTPPRVPNQETKRTGGEGLSLSPGRVTEEHMAEVTKGLENLQEAITACQQASTVVATASTAEAAQARSVLAGVLTALNEVSDKFFLKTMMSVPPTKACKTEAAAVAGFVADQKWASLPAAVEKLEKATKALVTKAKMDGTTIT